MPGVRWTFEMKLDLGELGERNAIVLGDVSVDWAGSYAGSEDEITVNIVSLEVFAPGKYADSEQWHDDHRLIDLTDYLRSPKGILIKQRLETSLEEDHYHEIVDHFRMAHVADRNEEVG